MEPTNWNEMEPINWNELLEDPAAIEASPLQRVIGVGLGRTINGITIELLALELRELGSFGTLRIEISRDSRMHEAFVAPEITARDSHGKRYSAMVVGGDGQSRSAGDSWWLRCRFSLVPRVPADADRLTIRVERLGSQWPMRVPSPEGTVDTVSEPTWTDGPWDFQVTLPD